MENGGSNESVYQGLLLRDQKYLRKNMQKICQLSVKESANRLIKRHHNDLVLKSFGGANSGDALKLDNQLSMKSESNGLA
jgi:hypothetical protein